MTVVFQASDHEPIASRLEQWRQVVDETFGPALPAPPFQDACSPAARGRRRRRGQGQRAADRLPDAVLGPLPGRRTPRLIRQSDRDPERYRVDLLARGSLVVEQAGREAALEAGDFTVVDWFRPARWATASERAVSLMFSRALLALPHEQVARAGTPASPAAVAPARSSPRSWP